MATVGRRVFYTAVMPVEAEEELCDAERVKVKIKMAEKTND